MEYTQALIGDAKDQLSLAMRDEILKREGKETEWQEIKEREGKGKRDSRNKTSAP